MANEHGLFWNSQNGDRVYDANDFSEWLKKFYTTGVFNGDLAVTASGGMTVSVSSGYVNIEGKVKFFSTPTTLTIATAGGTYERIDTVVAECNYSDREITVKVVTGAYSTSPTATAPVRTAAAYQLVLAQIDVPAGATEIMQKNITDKRMDSNVCGLVTGTVSQIDFSTVKAQFDSWFEDVKGTLDSDAAGNLKNQIDAANEKINTNTNNIATNTNNIATNTSAINTLNEGLTVKDITSQLGAPSGMKVVEIGNILYINIAGTKVEDVRQWRVPQKYCSSLGNVRCSGIATQSTTETSSAVGLPALLAYPGKDSGSDLIWVTVINSSWRWQMISSGYYIFASAVIPL